MNTNNPNDIQIFYKGEDGSVKEAIPVNSKPIKQIVEVMKKVEVKSPEAKQNEVSIKDSNGKRIKLDDQQIKNNFIY